MTGTAEKLRLCVLLISDGVPGHANQSRGLLHWLSADFRIECEVLTTRLRLKNLVRPCLPYLLRMGRPGWQLVKYCHTAHTPASTSYDLVISAGGNTSFLNVALARLLHLPNVFIGSKRRLHSYDFTVHLTLEPTGERNNIVMDLPPAAFDPDQLQEAGGELRSTLGLHGEQPVFAIFIGGDGAGYRFAQEDLDHLAGLMDRLARTHGCRWLLTTSRRTGSAAEEYLRSKLAGYEWLADAVWWSTAPRKVINAYLGAADAVFVTADSMSMISECISSGRSTTLVVPRRHAPDQRYEQALDRFVAAGYCARLHLESLPDEIRVDPHRPPSPAGAVTDAIRSAVAALSST